MLGRDIAAGAVTPRVGLPTPDEALWEDRETRVAHEAITDDLIGLMRGAPDAAIPELVTIVGTGNGDRDA